VGPPPIDIVVAGPPALHFKIDATEVTVQNYATFIKDFEATPPALQKQHDVCGWNHSVRPNTVTANDAGITTAPECDAFNLDTEVMAHPNAPMRCIDWCDAAAYCLWANGHMCQGDEGGQNYPVEWKNACQGASGQKFPYGPTYQAGRCVDAPAIKVLDVASKPICIGGYPGVYDMSGNVAEWLNCGCEYDNMDSTKTNAFLGGGAYHNSGDELDCTPLATTPIVGFRKDVGIRCCYDAPVP
jgi:formylglycine-generating enzyme required for sulfatase activity